MFLGSSLSCTIPKTVLFPTRVGGLQHALIASVTRETRLRVSCIGGLYMMPKHKFCWGRWLRAVRSGLCAAGHHCLLWGQCSRSLTAPWSPLPAELGEPPPPSSASCLTWASPSPTTHTHACQYNGTLHPSTEKKLRVLKITAMF